MNSKFYLVIFQIEQIYLKIICLDLNDQIIEQEETPPEQKQFNPSFAYFASFCFFISN